MKNKPKRHKAANTFKFQSFNERISSIDIDVFHKVKHPYEEEDEEITHYAQALTKWSTENFSPGYYELRNILPSDVTTLPQLLVQKDDIMKALIDHLKSCDIDSLQPALELIVAVAKDLRKEFFPYFNPGVLQECIRLLDTREVEQIEWVFTCLAHLFKYLWANIVKNINIILPHLLPLLSTSRPAYINNFVAESFAFVARKVRDKLQFLMLSLKNVKNNRDELAGVSKLFFETIKGVSNQFHSCTEEFLTIVLRQLKDQKLSELHFEICENLISHVTSFVTSKTNIAPVWNTLMKVTKEVLSSWQNNYDSNESETLNLLMKLWLKFITGREVILPNPQEITDLTMSIATDEKIRHFKSLHEVVIDVLCCILTTNKISTKIKNTNEMVIKILANIDDEKIAVHFVEKLVQQTQYECVVFREFLKFVKIRGLNDFLVEFLAKIVYIKTNLSCEPETENSLGFYTLGLKSVSPEFVEFLTSKIVDKVSEKNIHQVESSLHSIIILSYTTNCPTVKLAQKSDKFLKTVCVRIEATESTELKAKLLYGLLITVQYRLKCKTMDEANINDVIALAAKYVNSSDYLCSLRILYNLAESSAFECLNSDQEKLRLIDNLSSPFHKVRLFSSHVLSKMNIHPIFEQISEIEMIFPSIETYRDKLQRLQKFECNELFANVTDEFVRLAVLKFLFGNLYINFLYMWEPTQKLIQSHLENDSNAWKVFAEELDKISMNDLNSDQIMEDVQAEFKSEFFKEHFYQLNGVDDRPDFYNVRCLLLNVMTNVTNYSRLDKFFVAEHFLKFYNNEYTATENDHGTYCNVTLPKERDPEEDLTETGKKSGKNYNKLFLIYLKLISNLAKELPKKYKSDVFDIHFELLSNGNSDIQKYAVSFICRVKEMNPYKERLTLLTNDNSMKDQLLNIKIDLNSNSIPEQDVPYLMKLVLKILFGKLRKKSANNLRDAMFEFLMSCKKDEIGFFFDMVFKEFSPAAKDPSDPVIHKHEEIVLEKTISPSWVLNYLNHAGEIFKKCGNLLQGPELKYLLRILFKCISYVVSLQDKRSSVHPCYYSLISKIRVNAFESIVYFLENFEYAWSKDEIDALFRFFVDPWIEKISEECLQSPNPLMKLFTTFTNHPKFFPLLAKKSRNLTAMDALMGLLNSDKVYFNVKNSLVEIIRRLLTLEDEVDEEEMREFMCHDDVHKNQKKKNKRYGTILLMPYVSQVLQYLQASLSKKYIKLNDVYMLILNRVSEFGLDEEASAVLLSLLLPILRTKVSSSGEDDVVVPLLDTVVNLFKTFKNYDRFEKYLLQIAYLFGVANAHPVRQSLCQLVSYISDKTEKKLIDSELICGLNLQDTKLIGQPDYDGRLKTFKNINEARENQQISIYTGIFIVYNCFYVFKNVKDVALRDHSGMCLKNLCPAICEKYSDDRVKLNLFLNDILLPLIREGILSNDENYQHESVVLLGSMTRKCSGVHFVFRDLHPLVDCENVEMDFFENIVNLQSHQKKKAIRRFNEIMSQQLKAPAPYTLTFVFPLVTRCLSMKSNTLFDAALEGLGIICRLSTWRNYEKILKSYIMEMRKSVDSDLKRRRAVRIVSAILDSFHFDISQADQTSTTPKTNKKSKNDEIEAMEVDEEDEHEVSECHAKPTIPAARRITVLGRSDATRIYRSIKSFLIPSLDRIFMTYDDSEHYHKKSKKGSNLDKEELATSSIPLAYTAVKLTKRLPGSILDEYIPTIFLKLSTYLKSRLDSIRADARKTMENILKEIGPKYMHRLLSEMISLLTKGFQIHVLVKTCHAMLDNLKDLFVEGDIDASVDPILEICIVDLFGKLSEEKEIAKITSKTPEAKGAKSYHMLGILSEYISRCHVLDIIVPLKEILAINLSTKVVQKVEKCLKHIALGLVKNKFIDTESILELAYGVANDCIPELTAESENNKVRIEPKVPEKPDALLIPEEPKKMKPEWNKTYARTNAHVIIEFGLELLDSTLRQKVLNSKAYRGRLDPFIPIIKDSLRSQHIRLRILALKCLVILFKKKLPSLNEAIDDICDSIFEIMGENCDSIKRKDGKNELTKDERDKIDLLMAAAKAALVLVHDVGHKIDNCQVQIMLMVAEALVDNGTYPETGFSLMRAAIKRKFNIPEVHNLMMRISELSITSNSEPVRTAAREVYFKYLMDYPHGKKLRQYVLFFVAQLEYEVLDGRMSALEMLRKLLEEIPTELLSSNLGDALQFRLACRLAKEESQECKKMIADCMIQMIIRVKVVKKYDVLLKTALIWIEDREIETRKLAVRMLGAHVTALGSDFIRKLDQILPLIEKQLCNVIPRAPPPESESNVRAGLFVEALRVYNAIFENCEEILTDEKYARRIDNIAVICQSFLGHSHLSVRYEAARILRIVLKSIPVQDIVLALKRKKKKDGYLRDDQAKETIKSLCLDFCDQLAPADDQSTPNDNAKKEFLKETRNNLICLMEILKHLDTTDAKKVSLLWLLKKLAKQVVLEVAKAPQDDTVRTVVFKLFITLGGTLNETVLSPLLPTILTPIVRELETVDEQGAPIRLLAEKVHQFYREKISTAVYDEVITKVQRELNIKKAKRKITRAQTAVIDPVKAAKLKVKKQQKKKEQKKRRLEKLRKRKFKSRTRIEQIDAGDM